MTNPIRALLIAIAAGVAPCVALQVANPPTVRAADDVSPGPGGRYLVEFEAGSDPYLEAGRLEALGVDVVEVYTDVFDGVAVGFAPDVSMSCVVSHSSRTLKPIKCSASTESNHHQCNRRPCRRAHRGVSIVSISVHCRCRAPTATTAPGPASRRTSSTRASLRCTPTSVVGSGAVSRRSRTGAGRATATDTARMLRASSAGRSRALPRASHWLRCAYSIAPAQRPSPSFSTDSTG